MVQVKKISIEEALKRPDCQKIMSETRENMLLASQIANCFYVSLLIKQNQGVELTSEIQQSILNEVIQNIGLIASSLSESLSSP